MKTPLRTAIYLVALLVLAAAGTAQAAEIKILPGKTEKLEIRNVQLPGGEETTLYVISGSPVRLEVDGDRITAEYIEFDEKSRILRIVGAGDVSYDSVATKGRDYLLDMGSGELNFKDVFIFTEPLDIEGVAATRLPGQIDISAGAFSPCSRCQQDVQDYRFTAERMNLYPGDRLVAFNVTVYLRDLPSFFLPLLVIPLGPEERRPRLEITRGSDSERASVALDWPYVLGANAFGTTSLRYYADVQAGLSNSPTETILGGTVLENYFGGGFDHRFYTERGQGNLRFFYTPSFIDEYEESGKTQDEYEFTFAYATPEALDGLQTEILLERDDPDNQRILNLTARLGESYGGFDFSYVTQTFFDLDLTDDAETPAYAESEGALRTYTQLSAAQNDETTFSVGPFTLTNLLLQAGLYEDYAASSNSSALASPLYLNDSPIIRGGRLLEGHTLTLDAVSPFTGASISGSTDFRGQYYTTVNPDGQPERLIDWATQLSAEQTFDGGAFGLDFNRVILEGESPFQFDSSTTPANRTDLTSELSYSPLEWLELSVSETYVFEDSRDASELRAGPLESRLELFNNSDWFSATVEQAYDLKENDPGLLGVSTTFTSPSDQPLNGSLTLSGVYDLAQQPNRTDGDPVDESEADVQATVGYTPFVTLGLAAGYDFYGDPDDFGDFGSGDFGSGLVIGDDYGSDFGDGGDEDIIGGESLYKPVELDLALGTFDDQTDAVPGLELSAARDINTGIMDTIGVAASARVGPIEISADQNFDFGDPLEADDSSDSGFTLSYPDIIELEGTGFQLLPPAWVGLRPDPEDLTTYSLSLADLTQQDNAAVPELYELTYETSYGPLDAFGGSAAGLGFRDTSLTARVALPLGYLSTGLGPLGFGVAFAGSLAVADDALPLSYFSSGDLTLTTDFFSRFAVQGGLSYDTSYDTFSGTFSTESLVFDQFGATVRLWDDLYLSAVLDDTWDFINPSDFTTPYNLQPTFYLTFDRCCWALYAAYNTENGTISVSLGYPGGAETDRLSGAFNTPFILPRREGE